MRKRLRIYKSLAQTLQPVIPHCRRGSQRGVYVSPVDDSALLGRITPDAGETIGLQFQPDRQRIPLSRFALLQTPHPRLDSENLLHMMSNFVCDYVRLRELARSPEALLQFSEEREVQINLFVFRAIE